MAVTNIVGGIQPKIWIPPTSSANFKVTVERNDGTVDNITSDLLNLRIEDGVTDGIGIFEFEIPNPSETYTSVWTGMEIFRFYADYAATATTLRFRGRIEKPSNRDHNMHCTGRSESLFVVDQEITQEFSEIDVGQILYTLFDEYGEGRYDLTEINTSTGTTASLSWVDIPFWTAVEEICIAAGYDCYVNASLIVKFFEKESVINTTEGIVHNYNLIEVADFAPDLQFVKNKIRVYGAQVDDGQIIYTANDFTSQTDYGIRVETIEDGGISTIEAAKDYGEYLLENKKKNPPNVGEIKGIMLATIQPGEMIRLSSPAENLQPGEYRCVSYKTEINNTGLYTSVSINQKPKRLADVLKSRIVIENQRANTGSNPFDMDFSWMETFDTDSGTHSDTEITDEVLQLQPAKAGGNWQSPSITTADGNLLDQIAMSVAAEDAPNVELSISGDNGVTWQIITKNTLTSVTVSTTNQFKVKIRLLKQGVRISTVDVKYITK